MASISLGRVKDVLAAVRAKRVMVIGDVMLDRYLWGGVSRISPEAPVPVVEITEETTRLGGAANVANNIVSLGAACHIFGVVGDDHDGADLIRRLEERGIVASGLIGDRTRPTTVKTRIIAHSQQVVRTDRETRDEVSGVVESTLAERILDGLGAFDAIVISDYGKGVVTRRLLEALIPRARQAGKIVSVDPKDAQFRNYKRVSLITPNTFEAGGVVGRRITDETSLLEVGWQVFDLLEPDALLVTRGEKGMSLFEAGRTYSHFPTVARHVYDVTGAGDTVICSFTLALAGGATMPEAAQIANHAAGVVIREVGTAAVKAAELVKAFEDLEREAEEGR
jgi:D-beta-D-heptose 7-phosphate kinase/D-beta-D-heptose 1-phosphate adenosyltransferase